MSGTDQVPVEQHLLYNADYGILICRLCGHTIRPDGVQRHFGTMHKKTMALETHKALVQYVDTLSLRAINDVVTSDAEAALIKGSSLMDGCRCDVCGHLCVSEGSMREHCTREHGWKKAKGQV